MKFYPKRLADIEALEREKQSLKDELKQHDLHSLLSVEGLLGGKINKGKGTGKTEQESKGNALLDGITTLLPFSNVITRFVTFLMHKAGQKAGKEGVKAGKNVLGSVAKELVGGYVKWKSIELAGKGLLHFFNSKKQKAKENQEK